MLDLVPQQGEQASLFHPDYEVAEVEQVPGSWLVGEEEQTVWEGILLVLEEEKVASSRLPRFSYPFPAPL